MNTVTADSSLQQSLGLLNGLTEFRDSQGRVIGYFSPADADNSAAAYTQAAAHFDAEEMKRRKLSGEKGLTTAEVLDHLKSLEQ
ncbi:MAG TPA: hypothetical protein VMM76_08195 [Pirellulaceae bacterium]|nr:hypothetical protein [Pirellulaceae bacterium]